MDVTGIGSVADLIKDGIDKIWPDHTEQDKAQAALLLTALQGQLDTNRAEAANPNIFVAGWRPFIGWVCGIGFAIAALGPLLEWGSALFGHAIKFPPIDLSVMMPLLFGMLGLGGMRTAEKINGVNSGH
jgi:Holin of 3TMs, for gene-transfer release